MTISHSRRLGLWAALAAFFIGLPGASGTPVYHIREITAPGAVSIVPYAISNGGAIVGSVTTSAGGTNATFWRDDASVNLNQPGLTGSVGYAVNSAGAVAGTAATRDGEFRPTVWTRERTAELMPRMGIAMAIANSGDVAGWALGDDGQQRAFLWRRGAARWITDGPSVALAVNDRGNVAGYRIVPDGARAFLWEEQRGRSVRSGGAVSPLDGLVDLGTLGGSLSQALDVNNAGDVVGWAHNAQGETRAFVYRSGQTARTARLARMVELPGLGGTFSRANAITGDGKIVGVASDADGVHRATLWLDGEAIDLNATIPADSGWFLYGAVAVNDSGHIVGYGAYHGEPRSFLLY